MSPTRSKVTPFKPSSFRADALSCGFGEMVTEDMSMLEGSFSIIWEATVVKSSFGSTVRRNWPLRLWKRSIIVVARAAGRLRVLDERRSPSKLSSAVVMGRKGASKAARQIYPERIAVKSESLGAESTGSSWKQARSRAAGELLS